MNPISEGESNFEIQKPGENSVIKELSCRYKNETVYAQYCDCSILQHCIKQLW